MIEIRHDDDTRQVYDQIFTGDAIQQMESFFIWVCNLLNIQPGLSCLDIATGRGQMAEMAKRRGARAYGLDFSITACQHAKSRIPQHVVNSDAQMLPFADNSFDIVTNIGSLEHFESMDIAVNEMNRILKSSGKALLTVPNTFGLRWNVQYVWRTGDIDDDGQPLQRYGTRAQWEEILEGNGLTIERVLGYEHERAFPRTWSDLINYLKHPKRLISRLFIVPFIPINLAGILLFICRPIIPVNNTE